MLFFFFLAPLFLFASAFYLRFFLKNFLSYFYDIFTFLVAFFVDFINDDVTNCWLVRNNYFFIAIIYLRFFGVHFDIRVSILFVELRLFKEAP